MIVFIVNSVMVYCHVYSDSDSDSGTLQSKKEYVFTNKKDAVEAFKNLLRDKVSIICRIFTGTLCVHIICVM